MGRSIRSSGWSGCDRGLTYVQFASLLPVGGFVCGRPDLVPSRSVVDWAIDINKEAAKVLYRLTWAQYWETPDISLGRELDRLQPQICCGPGPEWDEFTRTIPGFREFWGTWLNRERESLLNRFVRNN